MSARTVWLASYPKSGNTWVRAMLAALDHGHVDLDAGMRASTIASARGPLEWLTGLVSSELRHEEVCRLRPLIDAALGARMDPELHPVWHRKIHDGLFSGYGGASIVSPEATRAAIYVVRDPRDVAVSYAHHLGCDLATAVEHMADPVGGMARGRDRAYAQLPQHLGTWSDHVEGWLDHDLFPVALVRYEDLLEDPVLQLRRLVEILGREATPEALAAATDAASFEKLQLQETSSGFRERPSPERAFFRRGIAGAWHDELPADLAARIECDHARVMTRMGYLGGRPAAGTLPNLRFSPP